MKIRIKGTTAECAAALTALRLSSLVDVHEPPDLHLDLGGPAWIRLDLEVQLPDRTARETNQ